MKRVLSLFVALALVVSALPVNLVALGQTTGEIAGTAVMEGKPLPNIRVRLRNVDSNLVVQNSRTNQAGQFRFTGLSPANYVVEVVTDDDRVLGTVPVALTAGSMSATQVIVNISSSVGAAAGIVGAGGAAGAAAAGVGFFRTTAGLITLAVIGAGLTIAIVAANNDGSPSR